MLRGNAIGTATLSGPRIPLRLMKVTGRRRTARRGRRTLVLSAITGVGLSAAIVGYFLTLG